MLPEFKAKPLTKSALLMKKKAYTKKFENSINS